MIYLLSPRDLLVVVITSFSDCQQLDRDFREGMLGLVGLLDDPSGAQPHSPRRSDTMDAMENE